MRAMTLGQIEDVVARRIDTYCESYAWLSAAITHLTPGAPGVDWYWVPDPRDQAAWAELLEAARAAVRTGPVTPRYSGAGYDR